MNMGEGMGEEELQSCLVALTGMTDLNVPDINPEAFIDQVLGFEEYDQSQESVDVR